MEYGFSREKYYIAEVAGTRFRLSKKGWCPSTGVWMTREELEIDHRAEYLGQGRMKRFSTWFAFLDLIVPFHEPNAKVSGSVEETSL